MTTADEKMREEFLEGICSKEFSERMAELSKENLPNFRIPDSVADKFVKGIVSLCAGYHVSGYDIAAAQYSERIKYLESYIEGQNDSFDTIMQERNELKQQNEQLQAQVAMLLERLNSVHDIVWHREKTELGHSECMAVLRQCTVPHSTTQTAEAYKRRVQAEALEAAAQFFIEEPNSASRRAAKELDRMAAELKEGE